MKTRTRTTSIREKKEEFWKSFTDILATLSLVFFFLMIIFISIMYLEYKNLQIEKAKVEEHKIKLEKTVELVDDIAEKRIQLYSKIESKLKPKLGDDIIFDKDEGRIDITTEILFDTNKSDLKVEGKQIAKNVAEAFFELFEELEKINGDTLELPVQFVEIRGHTDYRNDGEYNRALSMDRARNFVNEMVPKGTVFEKKYAKYFKASGMSKFSPRVGTMDNQTAAEMTLNRRIEIYIQFSDSDIEKAIKSIINSGLKSEK